ncbi:MAG: hypothetical protein WA739_23760, partial [Candidatus Acidiferrales bacterium]
GETGPRRWYRRGRRHDRNQYSEYLTPSFANHDISFAEVAYPNGYATSKRLDVGFDAGIELSWDEAGQPSTAPYVGAELELSSAGTRLLAWGDP